MRHLNIPLRLALIILTVIALVNICVATGRISLSDLVFDSSTLIVSGRVVTIFEVGGVKVAKVAVDEVLKGTPGTGTVFVLAQPTHPDDVSKAVLNEHALFFLTSTIAMDQDSYTKEFTAFIDNSQLFAIAHYGHGKMPIYYLNGVEHVDMAHSLVIPASRYEGLSPLPLIPDSTGASLTDVRIAIFEMVDRENQFLNIDPGQLFEYVKDGTKLQKHLAELALEKNSSQISADFLIQRLKDDDPTFRILASWLMANARDSSTVKPLINALSDSNEKVRDNAIKALGNMRARNAFAPLVNILRDVNEGEEIREHAADALAEIGNPKALYHLEAVLKECSPSCYFLQSSSMKAIFKLDHERGSALLMSTARSGNTSARRSAMLIIADEKLGDVEFFTERLLNGEDNLVKSVAAIVLGRLKADGAIKPLISMLDDDIGEVAAESLTKITGQDFGRDSSVWMEWYEKQHINSDVNGE